MAVPRFMTTMPPATLASVAASSAGAPQASASVKALMTVSPAPVTSAISSVPWTGMNVVAPSRSSRAMPRLPRVTRRKRASSRSRSWRPAFSTSRSPSVRAPASCASSASFGVAAVTPVKRRRLYRLSTVRTAPVRRAMARIRSKTRGVTVP